MSADPGSFGNALHILRASRRITAAKLEAATGVWRPTIYSFELGQRSVPYLTLAKLVRAMGLRMEAVQLAQTFDLGVSDAEIEVQE